VSKQLAYVNTSVQLSVQVAHNSRADTVQPCIEVNWIIWSINHSFTPWKS